MGFSHRDHRTHRTLRRGTLAVLGAIVVLIAVAVLLPGPLAGLVAVAALAGVGGLYAWHAHRLVGSYLDDLERVRTGRPVAPLVRIEAAGDIGLDRRTVGPTTRSPHVRRPVRRSDAGGAPAVPPKAE